MKKTALFLVPFLLFFLFPLSSSAASVDTALADILDELPEEVADQLPEGMESDIKNGDSTAAADKLDVSFFLKFFASSLSAALKDYAGILTSLLGILILAALLNATGGSVGQDTETAVSFVSGLCITLTVFHVIRPIWTQMSDTLTGIGLIIKSTLPAMTCIYAASGNLSLSAVNTTWLTVLLTLIEQLCESVLAPLLYICFGFLIVTSLSRFTGAPDMSGAINALRKTFTVLLSILFALFTAVMSYQTVLAQSSDTLLLRSLKFASGNMIPVVGGALSDAAGNYLASISLIRSSAGAITTASLLIYTLPVILKILICRIGLSLSSTAAGILGCRKESDLIKEAGGILELALALVSACAVIFILVVGIFTKAASGGAV